MATIGQQLIALNNVKTALKANLVTKEVALAGTETFAVLADKVLDIETGSSPFREIIENFSTIKDGKFVVITIL